MGCIEARDGNVWLGEKKIFIKGISWFGGETETYAPHGLWNCKTPEDYLDIIKEKGFNAVRYPTAMDTVLMNPYVQDQCSGTVNSWMIGARALDAMEYIVEKAADRGILVMLDMHRYDHRQWPDDGIYGGFGPSSGEQRMTRAWTRLATRFKSHWNVFGADLANEPHGAAWASGNVKIDFDGFATRVGNKIHTIAPHWMIVVEGVGTTTVTGAKACGIQTGTNKWWGENLECAAKYPVKLILPNRVIYSPHTYGPGVYEQPYFSGLTTDFSSLGKIWEAHWGKLTRDPTFPPILPGEWGAKSTNVREFSWLTNFSSYLQSKVLTGVPGNFFWSLNPNSGDTGGLLKDDWTTIDQDKLKLLDAIIPIGTDIRTIFPDYVNLPFACANDGDLPVAPVTAPTPVPVSLPFYYDKTKTFCCLQGDCDTCEAPVEFDKAHCGTSSDACTNDCFGEYCPKLT